MPRRNVQGSEVVVVGLDLGPFGYSVAQPNEEVHDLVYDAHRGVEAPLRVRHAGESHVHGLGAQALLALGGHDRREAFGKGGFYLFGGPVRSHTDLAAVFQRKVSNALLYLG